MRAFVPCFVAFLLALAYIANNFAHEKHLDKSLAQTRQALAAFDEMKKAFYDLKTTNDRTYNECTNAQHLCKVALDQRDEWRSNYLLCEGLNSRESSIVVEGPVTWLLEFPDKSTNIYTLVDTSTFVDK